jgi:hypothetical protein
VDERADEKRVEIMDGIMERNFPTADLVSYHSALSGIKVLRTVICRVDQDRIQLFDQLGGPLYKVLSENVR